MTENDHLKQYKNKYCQNFIKEYSGEKGLLKNEDGAELPCKFEIGQLENGKIILICNISIFDFQKYYYKSSEYYKSSIAEIKAYMVHYSYPASLALEKFNTFKGEDSDILINLIGVINLFLEIDSNSIDDYNSEYFRAVYIITELTASTGNIENINCVKFGITNFIFGDESDKTLLLNIKDVKRLTIKKIKNYEDVSDILIFTKGIRVTCDVIIEIDSKTKLNDLENIICDLCDLMSIAWGIRIQWVCYCAYNSKDEIVLYKHVHSVTKPYYFNKIIRVNNTETLKNFLEISYPVLAEKSNMLRSGETTAKPLINAYLDAKSENDYLEGRGIKLAVVMEMLKKAFLEHEPELNYIIKEDKFKNLQLELETAFEDVFKQFTNSKSRKLFNSNIKGINRRPFRIILHKLCKKINLQVENDYLQSVVDSRNKLVHEGNFLCESDDIDEKYRNIEDYPQFQDPEHEYYFLMNFVDKCFLKLLGYKGDYYRWVSASESIQDKLS
jgi:hypothetical protein